MSSYHQAIARHVFLEKFHALLQSIHQKEEQVPTINQYIKSYLELDGESGSLGEQIMAYLQQNAKLQRHLGTAHQFGLTWKHTEISEQAKISYVQLSIVAIVFEAMAQTATSLLDKQYDFTIKEIAPQEQALLKNFIKTIMPENRDATPTEGKLLGGIEAKIEEALPLVKQEAEEQSTLRELELAKQKKSAKAEIEQPKEEKKVKQQASRPEAAAAQQESSLDWKTVGFFAAGAAAFVGLALLSKGRGGPSL